MSDQSYAEAERTAMRRQAETLGADYADEAAVLALSDQLVFVRNNPISEDEEEMGGSTVHTVVMWGTDETAAIVLGRLRSRGWTLVRNG